MPLECGFIRFRRTTASNGQCSRSQSGDGQGNNGLYDRLIDCWNTLDIGCDEGMEVMTLAGDAPGCYLPPCWPGLSSCLCIVVIKDSRVCAIVWCLLRAIHLVRFCTLVAMMDVTAAEGSMIPMTTLSHLGGGQLERSGWPLIVSPWAGLMVPPMSALVHCHVLLECQETVYVACVHLVEFT